MAVRSHRMRGIARSRMPVSGSTSVAAQRTIRLTILSRAERPIASSRRAARTRARPASRRHRDCRGSAADATGAPAAFSSSATEARLMIEPPFSPRPRSCGRRHAAPSAARATRRHRSRRKIVRSRRGRPAVRRSPRAASRFSVADAERVAGCVEARAQLGKPRVPHQHQELVLGRIGGRRRVEAGGAVFDGVDAGRRQWSGGPTSSARSSGSGLQALHRVAVDRLDFRGFAGHGGLSRRLNEPDASLKALTKIAECPPFPRPACLLTFWAGGCSPEVRHAGRRSRARGSDR